MTFRRPALFGQLAIIIMAAALVGGCSMFSSFGPEPTATAEPRILVPTFTPTTEGQQPAAPQVEVVEPVEPVAVAVVEEAPAAEPAVVEPAVEAPAETPIPEAEPAATPAPQAKLIVAGEIVNGRQGPGTNYGLAGTAEQGMQLSIIGKNEQGTWWQVCCVNGEPVWIFGELATVENVESVQVAADIPAAPAPVAVAPQPAPQPAAPEPEPVVEAPPPQPQGDPDAGGCGGDDGCKFKIRGGPATAGNGGMELKLQFFFIHSGVQGGQPQGSYFVVMKKDGARLPVPDSVRSVAKDSSSGTLGDYNYKFSMGTGDLPGNNVAGNYTVWVLDGNGERDSDIFNFSIPEGEGLVWIQFDQG
jgi:uncharacterized protein YgiM (DUF1202 family)